MHLLACTAAVICLIVTTLPSASMLREMVRSSCARERAEDDLPLSGGSAILCSSYLTARHQGKATGPA